MNCRLSALILLLILSLVALLAASGAACAAGATQTTYTWTQIPLGPPEGGTTWTEGGITHVRGRTMLTLSLSYFDGDDVPDQVTYVLLTSINSDRDANGAGPFWGTWTSYDYPTGTMLMGSGTYQGKYTCTELLGGPEYAFGWSNPLGWGFGPNGDWGLTRGTAILYSEPYGSPFPLLFLGEASFLVPPGK